MSAAGQGMMLPRVSEGARWAACFALVLAAHAAAAGALIGHWRAPISPLANAPAILVDLAPAPAAPATPTSEAAPGPRQTQAAPEPEKPVITRDMTAGLAVEKVEALPLPPPQQQQQQKQQPLLREVVLPPRKPAEKRQKRKQQQAHLASAPRATTRKAARAVAPAPGARQGEPNALPNWKSALLARLERYKRYPAEAQARRVQGVAQLAFSVDRGGHVHHARIVRSSGSSLLDSATLALLSRAQPLPPPPPQMHGSQIAITVPIRYSLR